MVIYLDVLIFDNLILNYLILLAVSKFISVPMKKYKSVPVKNLLLLLGAIVGTLYSVIMVFVPRTSAVNWNTCKFLLSLFIVAISFFPKDIKTYFKLLLCFYIVSFVYAGIAVALIFLWGQSYQSYNGVLYFSWNSPIKYVALVAFCGFYLVKAFNYIMRKRKTVEKSLVEIGITIEDTYVRVPALIDTGNELRDPLAGGPVVIVETSVIRSALSKELFDRLQQSDWSDNANIEELQNLLAQTGWLQRFRMVPFKSLGCDNGLLPGIKPDYIEILSDKVSQVCPRKKEVIVCFYTQPLSQTGTYHALLGTDLLEGLIEI